MDILTALKQIQDKKILPVYLLVGSERYFQDLFLRTLEAQLFTDAASRSLNLFRLYGTENSLSEVLSALTGYPMLAHMKLVIVKELQQLKVTDPEPFLNYLRRPEKATCLVLISDDVLRNKFFKAVMEHAELVECKPVSDYKIGDIFQKLIKGRGLIFEERAARFLIEHIGNDLLSLSMELDKIYNFKNDTSPVTLEDVRQITGVEKEGSVFGLQDALGRKQITRCLQISKRLLESGQNINFIVSVLFTFFRKLLLVSQLKQKGHNLRQIAELMNAKENQIRGFLGMVDTFNLEQLEEAIRALAETDKLIKSSAADDEALLQMLCYKICRN